VQQGLRTLEKLGLILIGRGGGRGRSNIYTLVVPSTARRLRASDLETASWDAPGRRNG
jgi:hypothetical protein